MSLFLVDSHAPCVLFLPPTRAERVGDTEARRRIASARTILNNSSLLNELIEEELAPVFEAQLLTYMRLTECRVGLLMNFNVPVLKNGIKRLVL